ncbi:hypothetical protein FB451DRAFT_183197 [Mycena latifolia]|nr:hypothetical protein FB451DRAFT_183197 [Mycena latifolia]
MDGRSLRRPPAPPRSSSRPQPTTHLPHPAMRGLRIPRLALPFFTLLSTCTRFAAGQANRTVDDFSPLIAYSPADAVTHLNTTGFEVPKLYNGTIAIMNTTTVDQVNMTLKFTGTGIWLFLAKPVTPDGFGTGYDIVLDGVPVGSFASFDQEEDAEYGDVAFSNDTLPLGAHTIQLLASGMVYFDYARFTSNDPTPETTIPPVAAPTSSASASATSSIKSKETSQPASSPSTSATAAKSKSHVAAIAGAAAGVLLLIGGACLAWMLLRRRRPAGNPAQQYASGPQNPGSSKASTHRTRSTNMRTRGRTRTRTSHSTRRKHHPRTTANTRCSTRPPRRTPPIPRSPTHSHPNLNLTRNPSPNTSTRRNRSMTRTAS